MIDGFDEPLFIPNGGLAGPPNEQSSARLGPLPRSAPEARISQ